MKSLPSRLLLLLLALAGYPAFSQDYWEIVPTPDTAHPMTIAFNKNGDIFMGSNGVYLSQDTGETWEFKGLLGKTIGSIAIDSTGNVFAGTNKLYKSSDYGNTWDLVLSNSLNVQSIVICEDGLMFVGAPYCIFRSNDYGETWDTCYIFPGWEERAFDFAYKPPDTLYVGTTAWMGNGGGVYRTVDQGDTWEQIGLYNHFIQALALNPTGILYAGSIGHYYESHGGVYKYNETISDWIMLRDDLLVMDISINSDSVLFIGCDWEPGFPGGVYRSFDNGQSWDKIISGMTNNSVHKLCLSPDEYLYAITYAPSELFRSTMSTITEVHNIPQGNEYPFIYPNPFVDKVTIELSENVYNTFIQINL